MLFPPIKLLRFNPNFKKFNNTIALSSGGDFALLEEGFPPNAVKSGAILDSSDKMAQVNAGVAQLVEQLICNQPVASSSLVTSFQENQARKASSPCCESIFQSPRNWRWSFLGQIRRL